MSWEFTSIHGLNHAVRGRETCTFYSRDLRTGAVCRAYGFDVGQPIPDPPLHKTHRDLGLGEVRRILRFPSLHELTFAFRFGGQDWVVEMDGRRDELVLKFHGEAQPHVRHALVTPHGEVELRPRHRYEVGERLVVSASRAPEPFADISPDEALRQAVYGNAVRAPSGALYVPVNRAWVTMFGRMFPQGDGAPPFEGPVLFIWDAAFASVLAARVDVELALSNLRLLFEQLEPSGLFRQLRVGDRTNNLTGLPVVSLAVMAIHARTGAREHLLEFYPRLLAWNRWLRAHRDRNGDGLLEWGYEPPRGGIDVAPPWAAAYESGLDDSPMWQDEQVDPVRGAMTTSAVCLNALHAHDCRLLEQMARLLGREDEALELHAAWEGARQRVDAALWDDARGLYANRRWSGDFAPEIAPTTFFPLLAGVPDRDRAARLVRHLDDERTFGGPWRLPSIARSSPRFTAGGDYWRGRVWPPLNHLAMLGLAQYDERAAARLAEDSRRMFLQEWRDHGHVHENYSSETGRGEGPAGVYHRSCPFYTWGALLLLQP